METGTILYNNWGYEQTNIDFYLVVKKTDKTVTLRKLKNINEDSMLSMTGKTTPGEVDLYKKPIRKLVKFDQYQNPYIEMDHNVCKVWNNEPMFYSFYA